MLLEHSHGRVNNDTKIRMRTLIEGYMILLPTLRVRVGRKNLGWLVMTTKNSVVSSLNLSRFAVIHDLSIQADIFESAVLIVS